MKPLDNLQQRKVILASGSPRRNELLKALDVEFTVKVKSGISESYPATLPAEEVPEFLAREKAHAYLDDIAPDELVITADTVVIDHGGVILGKPHDTVEARDMLHRLSGHRHKVVTGVCLLTGDGKTRSFSTQTTVEFASLTSEEIDYYVERYRPLDKAGAYGIQEWIGCAAIKEINGSFYNVMGLPVQRLYEELKRL